MEFIKYETTLKACGSEYKKIVFWNRFLRNPLELILTLTPAVISIVLMCMGYFNTYFALFYTAAFCYPMYIFAIQFNSNVNYHLKHRDPAESAPCTMTVMESCILAEIPEYEASHSYNWEDFTTIYFKYGYYMMFNGSTMEVMLRKADMSQEQQKAISGYIKEHIDMNKCKVLF